MKECVRCSFTSSALFYFIARIVKVFWKLGRNRVGTEDAIYINVW